LIKEKIACMFFIEKIATLVMFFALKRQKIACMFFALKRQKIEKIINLLLIYYFIKLIKNEL
jgi:hypothetical protein